MTDHVHSWLMIDPNESWEVAKCIKPECKAMLHADQAEARLNAAEQLSAEDAKEAGARLYGALTEPEVVVKYLYDVLLAYAKARGGE